MTMQQHDLMAALCDHIGKRNGVRSDDLVREINRGHTCHACERRLRQLITELRLQGHHICAHPNHGYYIAENEQELDEACLFLYERAMTTMQQISMMKNISLPDLRGQLKLPT